MIIRLMLVVLSLQISNSVSMMTPVFSHSTKIADGYYVITSTDNFNNLKCYLDENFRFPNGNPFQLIFSNALSKEKLLIRNHSTNLVISRDDLYNLYNYSCCFHMISGVDFNSCAYLYVDIRDNNNNNNNTANPIDFIGSYETTTHIFSNTTRLLENIQYPMLVILLFMFLIVVSSTLKFLRMRSLLSNNHVPADHVQIGSNDFHDYYATTTGHTSGNIPPIYFIKSNDSPPSYDEAVLSKVSKITS